jgi:hypothetical protein
MVRATFSRLSSLPLIMLALSNCHPTDPNVVSKGRLQERGNVGSDPAIRRPAIDPDAGLTGDPVKAEELPSCGSVGWKQMERALVEWLKARRFEPMAAEWRRFSRDFASCAVTLDPYQAGLGPNACDGEEHGCVRARQAYGGLWLGAIFARRANEWRVVQLIGGDIP